MYYTFPAFARWALKKTVAEPPAPDDAIEPKKSAEAERNIDTVHKENDPKEVEK